MFLTSGRLRSRIIMALLVPAVGALIFSVLLLREQRHVLHRVQSMESIVGLVPQINGAIHELQKERGLSVGFSTSSNEDFTSRLKKQREATDVAVNSLSKKITPLIEKNKKDDIQRTISLQNGKGVNTENQEASPSTQKLIEHDFLNILQYYSDLSQLRAQINNNSLQTVDISNAYSSIVRTHLQLMEQMVLEADGTGLSQRLLSMSMLAEAKERMGMQRALGTAAFNAGHFTVETYRIFISNSAEQDAFMSVLRNVSPPEWLASYDEFLQKDSVKQVAQSQAIAVLAGPSSPLVGVTGAVWFDQMTRKINDIKSLEDGFDTSLIASFEHKRQRAYQKFNILVFGSIFLLMFCGLLGGVIIRSISRPLVQLTTAVETLIHGDYSVDIPCMQNSDEIGILARSIGVLKVSAQAMESQRWIKTNVAEISTLLQSCATSQELALVLLEHLIPALSESSCGNCIGNFYLYDELEQAVKLKASHGYTERSSLRNYFALGDGLIGQCAFERQAINQHSLDDDYPLIPISTGLQKPAMAIAQPIQSHGVVLGVLEIASQRTMSAGELELIEALAQSAATALDLMSRHQRAPSSAVSAQCLADELFG